MDKLPQELVDRISSYLGRQDLRNTLLLSRQFQYAAEQYSATFESYVLTESNAEKFLATYSNRRFNYLRYIHFSTEFPEFDSNDNEDNCRESLEELESLDQEFTRQINFLFSTVDAIESRQADVSNLGRIDLSIYTPKRSVNREKFCLHQTFVSWRVHLLSSATLPQLSSIQHLRVLDPDQEFYSDGLDPALRMLDHRILLDLSNKLPNLHSLTCKVGGGEWHGSFVNEGLRHITRDWAGPRRDSRHDFRKALVEGALSSLRHVDLDFLYPLDLTESIDQRRSLPNLVKPAAFDPFSTSIRLLSYQLRSMKLCVVADETLFWPTVRDGSTPAWPNLKSIDVMFHIAAPSGSWYFQGIPGVGSVEGFDVTNDMYPPLTTTDKDTHDDVMAMETNWDNQQRIVQFRVTPNERLLVPFLTAFARALAHMPSLKDAALWSPLTLELSALESEDRYRRFDTTQVTNFPDADHVGLAWGMAYRKPGVKAFDSWNGEDFCASRQLWWRVGKWRPGSELHELYRQVGRDRHGYQLKEYWDAFMAGEGLTYRDDFEMCPTMPEPPDVGLT
ncbi:uncharacterized protein N0V89_003301 [Didymosphaeria variabile]|uniref:F-box domain-containing protein n=1 Tax=Didymosphaeria variabile TaxID=1932322 RepID=A0A9W9CF78_9PLEO|nr:uncharacterized protein N0V89_003301 [Didymosphaeria variabile]KAJ4358717.1 hypothetical protein N0V89_003301 [Didymosphaeria variabile]